MIWNHSLAGLWAPQKLPGVPGSQPRKEQVSLQVWWRSWTKTSHAFPVKTWTKMEWQQTCFVFIFICFFTNSHHIQLYVHSQLAIKLKKYSSNFQYLGTRGSSFHQGPNFLLSHSHHTVVNIQHTPPLIASQVFKETFHKFQCMMNRIEQN